jgi:hypothetical protein
MPKILSYFLRGAVDRSLRVFQMPGQKDVRNLLEGTIPVGLLANISIVRKILKQRTAEVERLEIALDGIEDLAIGSDERGEWHGSLPA